MSDLETYMLSDDIACKFRKRLKKENIGELSDRMKAVGIRNAVFHEQTGEINWFQYDIKLPTYDISHQGQTGRCWIHAALNMIRPSVIEKHQLKDIMFSQNYIAFYDLLEKANYFLEVILKTVDKDADSRFLNLKLQHPIQDAGQWFFFQNIIEKYGIVTYEAMPETMHSQNTSELISVLSDVLREGACRIRSKYKRSGKIGEAEAEKQSILYAVYRILSISLGEPPEKFEAELEKKDGSINKEGSITPREFYRKYIHENYNEDYCMIVNIPLAARPYYETYKVSYLGNVWNAKTYPYINLPLEPFRDLVQKQIKAGIPVWFGCDSGVYADRKNGIYSLDNFNLSKLGYYNSLRSKEKNLQYGLSKLTHAMVMKGFSHDTDGRADRWLAENSYGEETGHKGCFTMSNEWFDLFVYEIVIHKRFLDNASLACCEKKSTILPPWDLLGTLAK